MRSAARSATGAMMRRGSRSARAGTAAVAALTVLAAGVGMGIAMGLAGPAAARSLWTDERSLYDDFRAHAVGDQVTILIVETASGTNQAATKGEKDTETSFDAGPGLGGLDFIPLIGLSGKWESQHDGKSMTSRSNRVQAKITAEVIAVRPNGDLQLSGTRMINVNDERHEIRLTGIVRPRDITADNTVLSTYVGDARVEYVGSGPVTGAQRIGWWKRILDWVF